MTEFSENHKTLLEVHCMLIKYYNELCDINEECEEVNLEAYRYDETEYLVKVINKLTKLLDDLDINYLKYYDMLD